MTVERRLRAVSKGKMENSVASLHAVESEEVRPYKIHVSLLPLLLTLRIYLSLSACKAPANSASHQVSSKYLDLTKKKLELTRLPHEVLLPREREWELGTPKSEIEPLIDFW